MNAFAAVAKHTSIAQNLKNAGLLSTSSRRLLFVFPQQRLPVSRSIPFGATHATHTPDSLLQYLEHASQPLESQAFFVEAGCMCADISGFTALSEKYCKQGTSGLDTLVQARDGTFGQYSLQ